LPSQSHICTRKKGANVKKRWKAKRGFEESHAREGRDTKTLVEAGAVLDGVSMGWR